MTLSSANILALLATPITLVAAPHTGRLPYLLGPFSVLQGEAMNSTMPLERLYMALLILVLPFPPGRQG